MNTSDPVAGYASWVAPDESSKVIYSLIVFGDLDAMVNDGYRRIPHGGVETAGVLFGTRNGNTLRVEAFRPIASQHAFGPSFILSETDRTMLHEQLDAAATDPELAGLEPLGWFVGHTRNPLALNDREVSWFDEFFPLPHSVFLVVKPERFQPTRYAFYVRDADGQLDRTLEPAPVVLPLSTMGASSSVTPTPDLPAPKPLESRPESLPAKQQEPPQPPWREPALRESAWREPPLEPPTGGRATRVRTPAAPRPEEFETQLSAPYSAPYPSPAAIRREPSDSTPTSLPYPYASLARTRVPTESRGLAGFGIQSIAILLLAAILGCAAGYWAYLQLPSPVIPVSVREQNGQVIVEWPANQTASVDYAALQVNEGQWLTLSPEQKTEGRATVSAPPGDLKIDLVAKHWLRDSRGIVKYLRSPRSAQ